MPFPIHHCRATKAHTKPMTPWVCFFDLGGGQNRREATGAQTRGRCNVLRRTLLTPLRPVHPKAFQPSHAARRPRDLAEPPEGFSTRPIHPRVSRPTLFQIRRSITVQLHTQFFCWEGQVKSNRQITFLVDNLCITSWQLVNSIILSKLQK